MDEKHLFEDIEEIKDRLTKIDQVLRGDESGETVGLVSRVKRLEEIHNFLRLFIGALAGSAITLLAAYLSSRQPHQ